jgi:hypothetical protein
MANESQPLFDFGDRVIRIASKLEPLIALLLVPRDA